ncbi:lysophospholipid acyltransferase family protein, partial [Desulfovibrio sp.]|uniref:lysophospholipid acyltransferase family protein n=1 Tax=Desulfovibrio sp. TaxID=885 RepID=UPI0023C1FF09
MTQAPDTGRAGGAAAFPVAPAPFPPFNEGHIPNKYGTGDAYRGPRVTPGLVTRVAPFPSFYARLFLGPVAWLSRRAAQGRCDDAAWAYASDWVTDLMERMGCPVEIEGMDAITATEKACIFVANHMSTLETFMLPGMIRPRRPVTFVVKESLVTMPFFGPIMRSRDPIVVGRRNPREDLAAVLDGGAERLAKGVSLVIFPQSTRSLTFDLAHFNSIAVKLARKAGAPLVPLALKTDAWGQGKKIKELGPVRPGMPIRYRFGAPLTVTGNGKEEQAAICDFIAST